MTDADTTGALTRLAGGVAHDFNNLLTIINGYSDLLLQDLPAGDPLRAFAAEILAAGERATALSGQLLAFSGRQAMTPRPLDLNAVVVRCEGPLRLDLSPGACVVVADAEALARLLRNLVGHSRGEVTVTTRCVELAAGRFVRLSVAGTGPGVAPELLPRIFEPYASGGLELAVVAGVARQLGGHVSAATEPGGGTTFVVEFPASSEA